MAAGLPPVKNCLSDCTDNPETLVQGPKGDDGAAGTNGTNGVDAFTTLTANFTMPAELASASATVADSTWMAVGQKVFMQGAGVLEVVSKATALEVTLQNLEDTPNNLYPDNVAPTTVIASGNQISPTGSQGVNGAAGSAAAFPTTTKGDVVVDGGGGSPDNPNRLAVGADDERIVADSGQSLGVRWDTIDLSKAGEFKNPPLGFALGGTNGTTQQAAMNALANLLARGSILVRNGAGDVVELALGNNGEVLQSNGTDLLYAPLIISKIGLESRQAGTDGAFTSGIYRTRSLNTEVSDPLARCTLAANRFTLLAGTYGIEARAPAYNVNQHQARIYDVTNTVGYDGTSEMAAGTQTASVARIPYLILAVSTTFEIQHQCATTNATDGFGVATGFGANEIFTQVRIDVYA